MFYPGALRVVWDHQKEFNTIVKEKQSKGEIDHYIIMYMYKTKEHI